MRSLQQKKIINKIKRHIADLGKIYLWYFWQAKGKSPYYTKSSYKSMRKKWMPQREISQVYKYKDTQVSNKYARMLPLTKNQRNVNGIKMSRHF